MEYLSYKIMAFSTPSKRFDEKELFKQWEVLERIITSDIVKVCELIIKPVDFSKVQFYTPKESCLYVIATNLLADYKARLFNRILLMAKSTVDKQNLEDEFYYQFLATGLDKKLKVCLEKIIPYKLT